MTGRLRSRLSMPEAVTAIGRSIARTAWIRSPALAALLVVLVTAYGGLLRLEAFVQKYGTLDRPAWARVLTQDVAPVATWVRPAAYRWYHLDRPYGGGEAITH